MSAILWRRIEAAVVGIFILHALDIWTTIYAVDRFGWDVESNPVVTPDNFLILSLVKLLVAPALLAICGLLMDQWGRLGQPREIAIAMGVMLAVGIVKALYPVLVNLGILPWSLSVLSVLDPASYVLWPLLQ